MADTQNFDVIILGGGLVGLTQALALARHDLRVAIIDRADPAAMASPAHDARVFAISSSSWAMFRALGVAERLEPEGAPIEKIVVNDGLKAGTLTFAPDDERPLGVMLESYRVRDALFSAVQEESRIARFMPMRVAATGRDAHGATVTLADGTELAAPLIIAADGRGSMMREAAGIRIANWTYKHHALVATIAHEHSHGNTAYELFYPDGPFALLPMVDGTDGRHRSAIVWTVSEKDGPGFAKLGDRGFAAELTKRSGGFLGALEMLTPRQSFPLGFHHCSVLVAERLALIGDAGHAIHPIAGQGLNLGLRDVAALTECIVEGARTGLDLGDAQLLARYDRWRGMDNWTVSAATDVLTRLFGLPGEASSAIRRFGIGMVNRLPPLKAQFMAEARGEAGELPQLLLGELV